jgi:hypothetical protein
MIVVRFVDAADDIVAQKALGALGSRGSLRASVAHSVRSLQCLHRRLPRAHLALSVRQDIQIWDGETYFDLRRAPSRCRAPAERSSAESFERRSRSKTPARPCDVSREGRAPEDSLRSSSEPCLAHFVRSTRQRRRSREAPSEASSNEDRKPPVCSPQSVGEACGRLRCGGGAVPMVRASRTLRRTRERTSRTDFG